MNNPLRNTVLGGAAVLALSMGAAIAAAQTSTSTSVTSDNGERRVVIMRSGPDGQVTTFDSASGGGGAMPEMMMRHGPDPERQARRLRDVLQLTPAQEPALQAFLTSMKPPEHEGGRGHDSDYARAPRPPMSTDPAARKAEMDKRMAEMKTRMAEMEKKRADEAALTTPQRLDMMVKHMAEEMARRQAGMQAHVDAVKRFYAALTPSQQKAFDALHGPGMMHGDMHGGMMHGGRGMQMEVRRMGALAPLPPLPPLPPLAARAPLPPLPPLPPAPPVGDR